MWHTGNMASLQQRMRTLTTNQWAGIAVLSISILLACALRYYRLDLIDFRFDQAYALQYALDITQGRLWAVQPHGSTAVHPPVYLYVMALPYFITRDFIAIISFRVFLDVLSVGLCWVIGTRYFNWRVGSIAAFLYACAPWAVQFARNTWPVPQPLFTAITLIGLMEILVRRNPWGWTISGIGLALCAGTHLAGIYIIPAVFISLWLGRKTFRPLPAIIGAIPVVGIAAVYVAYDATKGFANLASIFSSFGKPSTFSLDSLKYSLWLSGGAHLGDLTGQAHAVWDTVMPAYLSPIDIVQQALVCFGMFAVLIYIMKVVIARDKHVPSKVESSDHNMAWAGLVLLLWWWIPVALQLRHSQPVMLQYLPGSLPVPFLLSAIGINSILAWVTSRANAARLRAAANSIADVAVVALLVTIAAWQIAGTLNLTTIVERYDTSQGYGLPVKSSLAAAQHAKSARAEGLTTDVVVVVKDYATPWHEQALILKVLLADVPHRFINSDVSALVFGAKQTSYVIVPGSEFVLDDLAEYTNQSDIQISLTPIRTDFATGTIYARINSSPDLTRFTPAPQARWESGIELIAYQTTSISNTFQASFAMQVLDTPPEGVNYHWFNHLFVDENKIAQQDGSGLHPNAWRAGDIVIQQFDIAVDAPEVQDSLTLRIGSYTYPQPQSVMVSINGQAPTNGVDLPVTLAR